MAFLESIRNGRLYLDGGMGSAILKAGYAGVSSETLNQTNPALIQKIHAEYLAAGADIIYTNTFGISAGTERDEEKREIIQSAVRIAKDAVGGSGAYVAYSAGPTGCLLEPYGNMSFEEAYARFALQAEALTRMDVDCVVIETMTDTLELKAALLAFKENTTLPILCSMSFGADGRTFTGASVESFALIAQGLGADAVGLNCSFGAKEMLPLAKRLTAVSSVPVFIKPNAGMPVVRNGKTAYDTDAEAFSTAMQKIAALGISMLGGCCGTDAEYIKKTKEKTVNVPIRSFANKPDAVCSAQQTVPFDRFLAVGERVNPTGKSRLKQALLEKDYDYVLSLCAEQRADGADILDLNAGMNGIDEGETLAALVKQVQHAVPLPLQIDTAKPLALEKALRVLDGIGIVNSVTAEEKSLRAVLPLVKKYGAYVVGLCLDENGIPATAKARVCLAEKIVAAAKNEGIPKERVLIDPLTMAVSVDKNNARVTLETVRLLKKELGVKCIAGLSNVSFGLPNREILNATFFAMLLECGVDAAIINPKLRAEKNPHAIRVLNGEDADCAQYIAYCAGEQRVSTPKEKAVRTVADVIAAGLQAEAKMLLETYVTAENYQDVLGKEIIEALNALGTRYAKGEAFLPQLIAGAEAAKYLLEGIRARYMPASEGGEKMLLATVKGDVHDIGKNIVKAVLSNYGYRIIDLGKDVSTEKILAAVSAHNPKYVGLSALMTTTLENMRETAQALRTEAPNVIVLVGGAVVTQDFAEEIGAVYAKDPQDAIAKLRTEK